MYHYQTKTDPVTGERYLGVQHRGRTLLRNSMLNKGTAFALEERVEHERVRHRIGQGNNVLCFPGIGLGIIAAGTQRVTDSMLLAAARAVAGEVSAKDLTAGCVYPEMGSLRGISQAVAKAVVQAAIEEGLADDPEGYVDPESIARRVDAEIWYPDYLPYRLKSQN